MALAYLIDTDWAIHHLGGQQQVTQRLRTLHPQGLGVSIVICAELYEGVFRSSTPDRVEHGIDIFLEDVQVIELDKEITRIFGEERHRLRQLTKRVKNMNMDLFIAATALQFNLTLLTNNRKDFELIDKLKIESISLDA